MHASSPVSTSNRNASRPPLKNDITNPAVPRFICHANSRDYSDKVKGDSGPEGLAWVPASGSPGKGPLLLVANEVSGTLAVYEAVEK